MAEPKSHEERQTHHLYMIERLLTDYHKQSLHHLSQIQEGQTHHLYMIERLLTELLEQVRAARGPEANRKPYKTKLPETEPALDPRILEIAGRSSLKSRSS